MHTYNDNETLGSIESSIGEENISTEFVDTPKIWRRGVDLTRFCCPDVYLEERKDGRRPASSVASRAL